MLKRQTLSYLADQIVDANHGTTNYTTVSETDGYMEETYGSLLDPRDTKFSIDEHQALYDAALDTVYKSIGAGGYFNTLQLFSTQLDRYGTQIIPANPERVGVTFITRPTLKLTTDNLYNDRVMQTLAESTDERIQGASNDPGYINSFKLLIRATLDPFFAADNIDRVVESSIFNPHSAFNIPLCNALVGISGWPEYVVETETLEGGLFGEDFTFAKGVDRLAKTYDFNLHFRDIPGGLIMAMMYYWNRYMELVTNGLMVAYNEDIEERRLNYTVSIYRFTLDPTLRYIQKWGKATGCFPVNTPFGPSLDVSPGEWISKNAAEFQIPFKVNHVSYQDYAALMDFNAIVKRYYPTIEDPDMITTSTDPKLAAAQNFIGTPYIDYTTGLQPRLLYKFKERQDINTFNMLHTSMIHQQLNHSS